MSASLVIFTSPDVLLGLLVVASLCESVVERVGVGVTAGRCDDLVSVGVEVEVEGCGSE